MCRDALAIWQFAQHLRAVPIANVPIIASLDQTSSIFLEKVRGLSWWSAAPDVPSTHGPRLGGGGDGALPAACVSDYFSRSFLHRPARCSSEAWMRKAGVVSATKSFIIEPRLRLIV